MLRQSKSTDRKRSNPSRQKQKRLTQQLYLIKEVILMHPTSYKKGLMAEQIAQEFLEKKGLIFIAKRYKTPYGEIDLLMKEQETIVAIEVKFRKTMEICHYSIQPKQQIRIENALLHFAQTHELLNSFLRFDALLISQDCTHIIHYENAWQ